MGRHRHVANVRADGIAVVLGPLLRDVRIVAAALLDVDSGMVLDAWSAGGALTGAPDLELIGAQHAEALRCALQVLRTWTGADDPTGTCEVVLGGDDGCRHLLRTVPDPHGDRLALAVVVDGPQRVLDRVRKRLQAVSVDALTAGPSMTRRPSVGGWSFEPPGPDVPASPEPGGGLFPPARRPAGHAPGPAAGRLVPGPLPRHHDGRSGPPALPLGVPVPRDPNTVPAMAGLPPPARPVTAPSGEPAPVPGGPVHGGPGPDGPRSDGPGSSGPGGPGSGDPGPDGEGADERRTDETGPDRTRADGPVSSGSADGGDIPAMIIPAEPPGPRRPMLFSVPNGDPGGVNGTVNTVNTANGTAAPAAPTAGPPPSRPPAPSPGPRRPSPPAALPAPPRPRPPQT